MCRVTSACYYFTYGAKDSDRQCYLHTQYGWTMDSHAYAISGDQD